MHLYIYSIFMCQLEKIKKKRSEKNKTTCTHKRHIRDTVSGSHNAGRSAEIVRADKDIDLLLAIEISHHLHGHDLRVVRVVKAPGEVHRDTLVPGIFVELVYSQEEGAAEELGFALQACDEGQIHRHRSHLRWRDDRLVTVVHGIGTLSHGT